MFTSILRLLRAQTDTVYLPLDRQVRVVSRIAWVALTVLIAGALTTFVFAGDQPDGAVLIATAVTLALACAATLMLLRTGHVATATGILSLALYMANTCAILPYGIGGSNIAMVGFTIPLVLLSQLWGRFGVILAMILTSLSFLVISLLEGVGLAGWTEHEKFPVVDVGFIICVLLIVSQIVLRFQSEIKELTDALKNTINQLNHALDKIEAMTIAQERDRMAKEIHDGLGGHLHTINLYTSILQENPKDELKRKAITVIQNEIVEAQKELRKTIHNLNSHDSDQSGSSLEDLIRFLVRDSQFHGIDTVFQVNGQPEPLPEKSKHALYRITQEALTNIYKHASADHARIHLDYSNQNSICLVIADDGIGLNGKDQHGQGLQNIYERVDALGGTFSLTSDKGVTLWIRIPKSEF
ncbi:MAG TPA: histidine kinase [Roseiflexaceae bacterium]|nr:histidine kinase [Roseiflexaceae bacterium]